MNINLNKITKKYGNITVLDQISVEFKTGTITGLIGRNGSGKTMILKALCGFIRLDEGTISIEGTVIDNLCRTNYIVGAIIESPGFLPQYSGVEKMQQLFLQLKKAGKTIIIASHSKEDIMLLCDSVIEMDHGKVINTYIQSNSIE